TDCFKSCSPFKQPFKNRIIIITTTNCSIKKFFLNFVPSKHWLYKYIYYLPYKLELVQLYFGEKFYDSATFSIVTVFKLLISSLNKVRDICLKISKLPVV